MKLPRWLLISLLHPLASGLLLAIGSFSPGGKSFGAIGYIASLLTFLINLPGVLILQRFHTVEPSSFGNRTEILFTVCVITFMTWILFVMPLCWLVASRRARRRRGENQRFGSPRFAAGWKSWIAARFNRFLEMKPLSRVRQAVGIDFILRKGE